MSDAQTPAPADERGTSEYTRILRANRNFIDTEAGKVRRWLIGDLHDTGALPSNDDVADAVRRLEVKRLEAACAILQTRTVATLNSVTDDQVSGFSTIGALYGPEWRGVRARDIISTDKTYAGGSAPAVTYDWAADDWKVTLVLIHPQHHPTPAAYTAADLGASWVYLGDYSGAWTVEENQNAHTTTLVVRPYSSSRPSVGQHTIVLTARNAIAPSKLTLVVTVPPRPAQE